MRCWIRIDGIACVNINKSTAQFFGASINPLISPNKNVRINFSMFTSHLDIFHLDVFPQSMPTRFSPFIIPEFHRLHSSQIFLSARTATVSFNVTSSSQEFQFMKRYIYWRSTSRRKFHKHENSLLRLPVFG